MLTESSTTDSRWSKNAWCKVAALQFTVHLMPEVTHDITVRQVVDCKVMTAKLGFVVICICKYTWSQQDHLKVHGENHDRFLRPPIYHSSFSVLTLLLSLHALWSPVRRQCHIYFQDTLRLSFFGLYMAMFCIFISLSKTCLDTHSFPLESQYSWNSCCQDLRSLTLISACIPVLFSWRGACVHAMNPHRC